MSQPLTVSELSERSPDMDASEFAELVADIRANGQLVPIVVSNGEVIDGRKRLAACIEAGVEPKTVTLDPSQNAEAVARALNILRTHYTPSERAMFGADMATGTRLDSIKYARSSQNVNTKFGVQDAQSRHVWAKDAAKSVGVSTSAIISAKMVKRDGAPEVAEAVRSGGLTLHAAEQIVKTVPKPEQPQAVAKVIDANKGKARNSPIARVLQPSGDPRRDRPAPKPSHEQFARAVQSMDVLAEILTANVEAANGDARRRAFLETLSHIRTTLTRVIRAMEIAA